MREMPSRKKVVIRIYQIKSNVYIWGFAFIRRNRISSVKMIKGEDYWYYCKFENRHAPFLALTIYNTPKFTKKSYAKKVGSLKIFNIYSYNGKLINSINCIYSLSSTHFYHASETASNFFFVTSQQTFNCSK